MIIKKRNEVFETNSSAMHSIVVTNKDEKYPEEKLKRSVWIWDGELKFDVEDLNFGRTPFEVLTTFYDKLRYAIPSLFSKYNGTPYDKKNNPVYADPKWNELMTILEKYFKDFNMIQLPETYWFKDENTDEYQMYFGYIETDMSLVERFLDKENISLEEFLTNRKYIIIVDGDEYCIFKTLKKEIGFDVVKEFK